MWKKKKKEYLGFAQQQKGLRAAVYEIFRGRVQLHYVLLDDAQRVIQFPVLPRNITRLHVF